MTLTWTYLIGGLGALLLSVLLTPLFMMLASKCGVVDVPNARKVHDRPIPRSGGLAMAAACATVSALLFWLDPQLIHAVTGQRITLTALLATGFAVLAIGLMDDLLNVPGKYKLVALAAAAAIFAGSAQRISVLNFAGYSVDLGWTSWPLTILWLIAVPVSLNFLDGLDGLAGGVALMATGLLGALAIAFGAMHVAVISLVLAGCIGGFLIFNFNPAKVFMGDAGSFFLGYMIAALAVMGTAFTGKGNIIIGVSIALSLPILDTMLTFVRRGILLRRSLFSAERGHIHHRLLDLGLRHHHAVLLLYVASFSAAVAGLSVLLPQRRLMLLAVGIQLCVLVGLFRASGSARTRDTVEAIRRNRRIGKDTRHYRGAFEDLQVRFRLIKDFNGWWREVCAAAEMLDFMQVELALTCRNSGPKVLQWKNSKEFDSLESVGASVPIAHRRPGGPLRAHVEVATHGLLESAGERLALFTRLLSEFSVASLPDDGQPPPRFSLMSALKFGPTKRKWHTAPTRLNLQKYVGEMPFVDDKPVSQLKVAIVHDFLYCYGGAERVLEQIIDLFPNADLFSVFDFLPKDQRGFLKDKAVTTTFIQKMPFAKQKHRAYLPLMPLAIEQLNLSKYDLIISSSYVVAKGVLTRPDQLHICYCHSPARFAWDLQNQYLGNAGMVVGLKSVFARLVLHYTRMWDVRSSVGVDVFLSNSLFVGRRIEKVYRRQSTPLYPPVDVGRFSTQAAKEDFYLTASRLVPYKRTAVIVEAFNRMPERRLFVVGEGPELEQLRTIARPNVRILGYQSAERLKFLMQHARAFVFAAEEDFGIVAVEAQACGTPVIAYGRGGVTETVIQNKTGMFFREQTPESIAAAVIEFENRDPWDANEIRANAESFSVEMFRTRLMDIVYREWAAFVDRRKRNIAALRGETDLAFSPPAKRRRNVM